MVKQTEDDTHYSNRRLQAVRRRLAKFERNGKVAVNFVDAMTTYGIKTIRVSSLGWHAWGCRLIHFAD
jgi:hypothetical protein